MSKQNGLQLLKENKKVVYFLLRFLGVFGSLSIAYGAWVKSYGNQADAASWWVGYNLRWLFGEHHMQLSQSAIDPSVDITYLGKTAVTLFEGCNGIAVMILFIAFVVAFKGRWKDLWWFIPFGLLVIHIFNLARLSALIVLADMDSSFFHFMHKYLFTLIIYAGVFLLWVLWVKLAVKRNKSDAKSKP